MAKTVRAAIYARISSDQEGTGLGVARQRKDCRALAAARGWDVAGEFVDNDISASSGRRRPEYERMLDAMRERRVDAVIVYHLDRLTRRPRELEDFVELCDRLGIKNLATVAGDLNIGTGDGLLVARIQAAVAANESASKSRRMRRKQVEIAEAGLPHVASTRPFGYERDGITINKAEAKVIRQCAKKIIAGESVRGVAQWLVDSGVPTVNGAEWRTPTIQGVLLSARVVGMRSHLGEIVGPAVWKPILTESEQQQVKARIAERRSANRRTPQRYALSGMLRCGKCGQRLYSARREHRRRYVCLSGPDHGGCGRLTVVAEPVEELIAEAVLYRLDSPQLAAALRRGKGDRHASALNKELAADEAQRDELATLYASKQITAKEWIAARNPIEARIQTIRRRLAEQANSSALADLVGKGDTLRAAWSGLTLDRQVAIIAALIDHIAIGAGTRGATTLDPARVQPVWIV
jgi:DNA invertase Pin-like site-specific DNA recombinase